MHSELPNRVLSKRLAKMYKTLPYNHAPDKLNNVWQKQEVNLGERAVVP